MLFQNKVNDDEDDDNEIEMKVGPVSINNKICLVSIITNPYFKFLSIL